MIDDYAQAMDLVRKMEDHLPIPVRLASPVVRMLRQKGLTVTRSQKSEIKRAFYFGDEGGIMCDVTPAEGSREAVVISRHICWSRRVTRCHVRSGPTSGSGRGGLPSQVDREKHPT